MSPNRLADIRICEKEIINAHLFKDSDKRVTISLFYNWKQTLLGFLAPFCRLKIHNFLREIE